MNVNTNKKKIMKINKDSRVFKFYSYKVKSKNRKILIIVLKKLNYLWICKKLKLIKSIKIIKIYMKKMKKAVVVAVVKGLSLVRDKIQTNNKIMKKIKKNIIPIMLRKKMKFMEIYIIF